ncbi:MAG: hypothetical protein ACRD3N_10280 [Terracidiphilus sp.]
MEQRLSEWLSAQIELFDMREGKTPSAADQEARFCLERIAEELVEGREAFTDPRFEVLERALRDESEITEGEIDRVLAGRVLLGVSGMVKRVVNLSKLDRTKIPSDQTERYVREAARSYLYGLYQASAAMSRVALEQSLKEVLGRQGTEDFIPFKRLRKEAERRGILDGVTGPAARKIAEDASEVIHRRPTDSAGALEILDGSRGLIVQVYEARYRQSSGAQMP